MERSERNAKLVTGFLVIFHFVGIIGLHLEETRKLFQSLTPLNLLLTVGLLAWFHRSWTMKFGIFAFIIFWAGYLVEVVGVYTGAIFGSYTYGEAFGFRLASVPPLIGLNWLMLVYLTGMVSQGLVNNIWARATVGAILLVFLDFLIEPVAMTQDFWHWRDAQIPAQNYFAWFLIGWVMLYGFHSIHEEKSNAIALPVYLIQIMFFATFMVVRWGLS
ncbi:MAG: carotenoid biosynthesis protein [Bacteroidia bacterium]|nr:carotenoid biosynthesis protein [Bacteroidia bacterium]